MHPCSPPPPHKRLVRKRSESFDLTSVDAILKKVKVNSSAADLRLKHDFALLSQHFSPWYIYPTTDQSVTTRNIKQNLPPAQNVFNFSPPSHKDTTQQLPLNQNRIRAYSPSLGVIVCRKDNLAQIDLTIDDCQFVIRIPKKYPYEPPIVNRVDLNGQATFGEGIGGALYRHHSLTPTNMDSSYMTNGSSDAIIVRVAMQHEDVNTKNAEFSGEFIWDATKSLTELIFFLKKQTSANSKLYSSPDRPISQSEDLNSDVILRRSGNSSSSMLFGNNQNNENDMSRSSPPLPPVQQFGNQVLPTVGGSLRKPKALFSQNRHDQGFPKQSPSPAFRRANKSMDFADLSSFNTMTMGNGPMSPSPTTTTTVNSSDQNIISKASFGSYRTSSMEFDDESPVKIVTHNWAENDFDEDDDDLTF